MPDFLAATYFMGPRNDFARSALPGSPVKAARQRRTRRFRLAFAGVLIRRTVEPVS
ncbi:hypothetical protein [Nonomuraea sp. NPDC050786]|uniref:hypothetical protein n=1 Tax=Nonomuraea sp. NPDC050786 TaxID=3154840 RepID=UPI0033D2B658